MQRIIIENFGPIQHLDLEIKDLSLFIGEQATGKSTVAKLIYFFKSLRGDLIGYLYQRVIITEDLFFDYMYKKTIIKFNQIFDALRENSDEFNITFKYNNTLFWRIQSSLPGLNRSIISIGDNESVQGVQASIELKNICIEIEKFKNQYYNREIALLNSSEKRGKEIDLRLDLERIENRINDFFDDDREIQFIPASRSLLTSLPEHLQGIETNGLDFLMTLFLTEISRIKPAFDHSLDQLLEEKSIFLKEEKLPNQEVLELSIQKIKSVLKGEYRISDSGEEKIYFDDKKYIKLSMASSGQQEAVWILMQTFLLLLNREKVFLVIEEPEAHLSPEAQKSVVELITLLLKENDSQVLITTHSPYILTAFNNLIYAGNVGKEHAEEVGKIIPPQLWIDSEQVGAYKLRGGTSEDLMDRETMLIRAEELDSVSRSINEAFDAILNLELQ